MSSASSTRAESSTQGAAREIHSRRAQMTLTNRSTSTPKLASFRSALESLDLADVSFPTPEGPTTFPLPSLNSREEGSLPFKRTGNQYIYHERYHSEWEKWWESTAGYSQFLGRYKARRIYWNSNLHSSSIWKGYVQYAQASKTSKTPEGWPGVQCLVCSLVIAHLASGGTISMNDHIAMRKCKQARSKLRQEAGSPTITQLFAKGTKTIPWQKVIDAKVPEVFDQEEFDGVFLQELLAVNLGFNVANNVAFQRMFRYLNRKILIPSLSLIRCKLLNCYREVVSAIKADIPQRVKVSIAVDAWTSLNKLVFLAVLAYYITDNWKLKEVFLSFEQIHGLHTGENLAKIIEEILNRYDIADRLLGFTSDNASNNTTLSSALTSILRSLSIQWDCESYHIPCMVHVIQLILGTFMKELKIKIKDEKMPTGFKDTYIDKVKALEKGFYKTVEKHRKLAIAVEASLQQREHFLALQDGKVAIPVALVYDVKTRWNSMGCEKP